MLDGVAAAAARMGPVVGTRCRVCYFECYFIDIDSRELCKSSRTRLDTSTQTLPNSRARAIRTGKKNTARWLLLHARERAFA